MKRQSILQYIYFAFFAFGLLLLFACNQALPPSTQDSQGNSLLDRVTSPPVDVNKNDIPPVDRTQAVVPAEEIFFDTFRSYDRVVPLNKADDQLILRLLDAIPPIYNPKFVTHDQAGFLSSKDLVLGYAQGDIAIAYPIKILNWHEIVSHDVDGVPIIATY